MKENLLLGCGKNLGKKIHTNGIEEWDGNLITVDSNIYHNPDVVWDLNNIPYPFKDNQFNEIHIYEVLEHLGTQGDFRTFFAQFTELWRILKPGGLLACSVPSIKSPWTWGDPGHTRIISMETLSFLIQPQYTEQVGKTNMSDYRFCYQADFDLEWHQDGLHIFYFLLKAIKPTRREI